MNIFRKLVSFFLVLGLAADPAAATGQPLSVRSGVRAGRALFDCQALSAIAREFPDPLNALPTADQYGMTAALAMQYLNMDRPDLVAFVSGGSQGADKDRQLIRVLLVEDNDLLRKKFHELFEKADFKVTTANNGEEALKVLARGGINFVLTDLSMPPGMNGLALIREARKLYPDIPMVLWTQGGIEKSDEATYSEAGKKAGALEVFFNKTETLAKITDLIRKHAPAAPGNLALPSTYRSGISKLRKAQEKAIRAGNRNQWMPQEFIDAKTTKPLPLASEYSDIWDANRGTYLTVSEKRWIQLNVAPGRLVEFLYSTFVPAHFVRKHFTDDMSEGDRNALQAAHMIMREKALIPALWICIQVMILVAGVAAGAYEKGYFHSVFIKGASPQAMLLNLLLLIVVSEIFGFVLSGAPAYFLHRRAHYEHNLKNPKLAFTLPAEPAAAPDRGKKHFRTKGTVRLDSGLDVGYVEYGNPVGKRIVVYLQGSLGSGLEPGAFSFADIDPDMRLIAVERPGIGQSSFNPDHTVEGWVTDLKEFADKHLGKEVQFELVAYSAGCKFADACARSEALKGRILKTTLFNPPGTLGSEENIKTGFGEKPQKRYLMALNNIQGLEQLAASARNNFLDSVKRDSQYERFVEGFPKADYEILRQGDIKEATLESILRTLKNGTEGWVSDMAAVARYSTPFLRKDFHCPVTVVFGEDDKSIPQSVVDEYKKQLPADDVLVVPGGHRIIAKWFSEIMGRPKPPAAAPKEKRLLQIKNKSMDSNAQATEEKEHARILQDAALKTVRELLERVQKLINFNAEKKPISELSPLIKHIKTGLERLYQTQSIFLEPVTLLQSVNDWLKRGKFDAMKRDALAQTLEVAKTKLNEYLESFTQARNSQAEWANQAQQLQRELDSLWSAKQRPYAFDTAYWDVIAQTQLTVPMLTLKTEHYYRVGWLFFIAEADYESIPEAVRTRYARHFIKYRFSRVHPGDFPYPEVTVSTLLALQANYKLYEGREILDAGTGDAAQAIAAVKMGASRVFAVEKDETWIEWAYGQSGLNHLDKRQIEIIHDDVVRFASREKEKLSQIAFVIANVGRAGFVNDRATLQLAGKDSEPIFFKDNLHFELRKHLPQASYYLLAGITPIEKELAIARSLPQAFETPQWKQVAEATFPYFWEEGDASSYLYQNRGVPGDKTSAAGSKAMEPPTAISWINLILAVAVVYLLTPSNASFLGIHGTVLKIGFAVTALIQGFILHEGGHWLDVRLRGLERHLLWAPGLIGGISVANGRRLPGVLTSFLGTLPFIALLLFSHSPSLIPLFKACIVANVIFGFSLLDWWPIGQIQAVPSDMPFGNWRLKWHLFLRLPAHRYGPLGGTRRVQETLAAIYQVPADWILPDGGGSTHLIPKIIDWAKTSEDTKVLLPEPNFASFGSLLRGSGHLVSIVLDREKGFVLSPEEVEKKLEEHRVRMVVLTNPHNPSGSFFEPDHFAAVIRRHPDTLFLFDEAFGEFAESDAIPLMKKCPNVAILRTFDKAYGLAGIRAGYLIARPEILSKLQQTPLSPLQEEAALFALRHPSFMKKAVSRICFWRSILGTRLRRIPGLLVFPSITNFILIDVALWGESMGSKLDAYLVEHNILVYKWPDTPGVPGDYIRIVARTPLENTAIAKAIEVFYRTHVQQTANLQKRAA